MKTPRIEEKNWRDEYKALEQGWMHLKDQYSEIAKALGFKGDTWFGDPLADHAEIVSRAKQLTQAHQAGIDEAVEKMMMKGDMGKLTPFQETVNTYIKNRGQEIIKALQDNK